MVSVHDMVRAADEAWCEPDESGIVRWTTSDLGDFVQGVLEAALVLLEELKPEIVQHCGDDGVRCPEHQGQATVEESHLVTLFTTHSDD